MPHLSSQWPTVLVNYNDTMNFRQRLWAFSMGLFDHAFTYKNKEGAKLLAESAMWWYLYDISVGYPRASMPNTLDVGDIMARPAQPLPQEYVDIMDKSAEKAILVSLGSHFDHVPEEWMKKFCKAFNSVRFTIIWKLKLRPPCESGPNIHIKKWVPQNDLLAHPKLGLFITHCGLNSVIESVSHGKPMLGFPISLDQPYNGVVIESKGYGKTFNLKTFTADELVEGINDVIGDDTYLENTKKGSEIMHSKVTSPGKRMSFWAEHIVKFGDSHLRTKAHELSLMQFLMFDIFLALVTGFIVVVVSIAACGVCGIKCCRRCCCKMQAKVKTQ